jgi:hypothetical protein
MYLGRILRTFHFAVEINCSVQRAVGGREGEERAIGRGGNLKKSDKTRVIQYRIPNTVVSKLIYIKLPMYLFF